MPASFPATVPVFTVLTDGPQGDEIVAANENVPNAEITAIGTFVGNIGTGLGQASSTDLLGYLQKARNSFRVSYVNATTVQMSQGECIVTNSGITQRVARKNTSTTNLTGTDLDAGGPGFAVSTTYYVYATADAVATTVTFIISTNGSAPAGYTRYVGVAKFATDSSGNVISSSCVSYVGDQVVQVQYSVTGSVATGTTVIPADNTKPQITEGDQYLTLTALPTNASNLCCIEVLVWGATSHANGYILGAIFQDSGTDALAAGISISNNSAYTKPLPMTLWMLAGTVSATTFTVRCGPSAAATFTLNGQSGNQLLGGVLYSFIKFTEYRKVYA